LIGWRAGVPRMHPHAARHWFATSLLKDGTDIRLIQEVLGHADFLSSQVYTHLAKTDIGRMVSQFFFRNYFAKVLSQGNSNSPRNRWRFRWGDIDNNFLS